jgi:hypothetical protein
MPSPPAGQHDYSSAILSEHALERFSERFELPAEESESQLRIALKRSRSLGRNQRNSAVAVLAIHKGRPLAAIFQKTTCLTVLTWNQFLPHLHEFGRKRPPRKRGRFLRRLGPDQDPAEPIT